MEKKSLPPWSSFWGAGHRQLGVLSVCGPGVCCYLAVKRRTPEAAFERLLHDAGSVRAGPAPSHVAAHFQGLGRIQMRFFSTRGFRFLLRICVASNHVVASGIFTTEFHSIWFQSFGIVSPAQKILRAA